ncbi:MAG TPA: ABC transporter ATP-binding protein [Hyphomicrobiales bacterium]|nr:ABC transporter ATP-binding protein [Hyphomicrobiales bacterium]
MLKVEGLEKAYATAEGTVRAVDGVSFEVPDGGFFTLLGPSGCGKTTTLRSVAGLERPTGGRISIGEVVVSDPARGIHVPAFRRDIGMVFQSYAIWPHMDVFGNVAYPMRVLKPRPSKAEIATRVHDALRLVGLESMASRSATKLSGGQQQRVAFARAVVRHPKLLLLDEPLSNLDAKLREEMRNELQELVARVAITTLYVTHDQSEALAMSDNVAVMEAGRIVQCGPPREVYGAPSSEFVAGFLGAANFLKGRIVACAAGRAEVEVEGGTGRFAVAVPDGLASGDLVDVVFRPEDATIAFAPPAGMNGNVVTGVIERLSFQGGSTECHLKVGEARVRSILHPSIDAVSGRAAWISLDAARCVVFPHAGAAPETH